MKKTDIAIIGLGVAGYAAIIYGRRFGLDVTVFDPFGGGTITKTDVIENYPGFKAIQGQELAEKMKEQAFNYKPNIIHSYVISIQKKDKCFVLEAGKETFQSKTVILATGTKWKKLGVPGEDEFANKGVHYCATCDAFFYKDKTVAVVGSGNSTAKDALVLAEVAKKVYIITRREEIHPEPINLKRVKENKKIETINNANIKEIKGDKKLKQIILDRKFKSSNELELDGLFIDIGRNPITEITKNIGVKLNKSGEVITDKLCQTNIPGFFAAGDVSDIPFKQAIIAASEGSIAAQSAYEFITKNHSATYE